MELELNRKKLAKCENVDEFVLEDPRSPEFTWVEKPFGLEQWKFNVFWIGIAHVFAIYYSYLLLFGHAPLTTIIFTIIYGYMGGLGITVGCHRYWTHKSFKANLPLQFLLMLMQLISSQWTIYDWSLNHRIHHKFTDTDADPHNSKRGFYFSHIGWLFAKPHPDVTKKRMAIDMSDLENDFVVKFQNTWFWPLALLMFFVIPIGTLHLIWGMPLLHCAACNYFRYVFGSHFTFTANSVAHMWGDKPYDESISSVENPFVSIITVGEGWHNYHHTFPYDYRASEFGWKLNVSTMFIDFFAWLGWASHMKTVSDKTLKTRLRRTGDGSHADAIRHEEKENCDHALTLESALMKHTAMKDTVSYPNTELAGLHPDRSSHLYICRASHEEANGLVGWVDLKEDTCNVGIRENVYACRARKGNKMIPGKLVGSSKEGCHILDDGEPEYAPEYEVASISLFGVSGGCMKY